MTELERDLLIITIALLAFLLASGTLLSLLFSPGGNDEP